MPDQTEREGPAEVATPGDEQRTRLLATLLDSSSQPFAAATADGRLLEFNRAYEELTGYSSEELRALSWKTALTPPEWRATDENSMREQERAGGPIRYEKEYLRKDGTRVPVEVFRNLHKNERGETDYYYAFITDLTERKRAEKALAESEARYRGLFANLVAGVALHEIVLDEEGKPIDYVFLEANDAFERLTGLARSDILGKRVTEVLPGIKDAPADWVGAYGRVALTGEPTRFEQFATPMGKWFSVTAYSPQRGQFAVVFDDITERRAAERRLQAERREIEVANRLLRLFVEEAGDQMYSKALAVVLEATGSKYGVFGYVDENGDLVCPTMSDVFDECDMEEKCIVYGRHKWTGLWGRALTEKRVFHSNEPLTVPTGHVPMLRNLAVPILFQDRSIGLLNLANKTTDYTEDDIGFVEGVADRIAPVLYAWIQKELRDKERKQAAAAMEEERARLREIIDEIPVGVTLIDPDGAILEVNRANALIWGGDLPRVDGPERYGVYRAFDPATGRPFDGRDWPVVRTIASGENETSVAEIQRFDGTRATVRFTTVPIHDAEGKLERVIGITEDVTEQTEREALLGALSHIRNEVGATFDQREILSHAARLATPALGADAAVIVDKTDDHWTVAAVHGLSGSILGRRFPADDHNVTSLAALARHPVIIENTHGDTRADPERAILASPGTIAVVPVLARGVAVAAMEFIRYKPRPFTGSQADFCVRLMSVVALAIDNALVYQRERTIADTLQEALLTPLEPIDGLAVGYLYRPASAAARVGGDFYDLFRFDDDKVVVLIGDVSGKGVAAARLTSLLRDGVRAYAYKKPDPGAVLKQVNELVYRSSPLEAFATLFLGVLELSSGRLAYCSAGHSPAVVLGEEDSHRMLEPGSSIVGGFAETHFETLQTVLEKGETLVLYTDGVTEARRDGEMFGEERLLAALGGMRDVATSEMPERLLDEVLRFSDGELRDDTVILCLSRMTAES